MPDEAKSEKKYVRPFEAARLLGVGRDAVGGLGLERIDMRRPGAPRPQWRYLRAGIEAFIQKRTENAL